MFLEQLSVLPGYRHAISRHNDICVSYIRTRIVFVDCFVLFCLVFFYRHFYVQAQLVGGFTLSDLVDKPWSQVGFVPSPPRYVPSILWRIGFSIPTARRFSSNVASPRSRAFP